jgi:Ca-activated chloride channel family protein
MLRLLAAIMILQATFSVHTEIVSVPVSVTDTAGNVVRGLPRDAFRVREDGKPRPIELFEQGDGPAGIGVIADYSQSMQPDAAAMVSGIAELVRTLSSGDEFFVLPFNDEPSSASRVLRTRDPAAIGRLFSETLPAGGTALYDGLVAGLDALGRSPLEKRGLIVISDGGDNASRHRLDDVVALALRSNAVIYAAIIERTPRDRRGEDVLRRLARDTGGLARAARPSEIGVVLTQFGADMRAQYLIGFVPGAGTKATKSIEVTVTTASPRMLRVRARSSYSP